MKAIVGMPHTKDSKRWSQEEREEHSASLVADNPCYYCISDRKQKLEDSLKKGLCTLEEYKRLQNTIYSF